MAANRTRLDQYPGAMTNHADRFASLDHDLDEVDCRGLYAQLVGIDHPAWQYQGVILLGIHILDRAIHSDLCAPILACPGAYLAALGRYDLDFGTGLA